MQDVLNYLPVFWLFVGAVFILLEALAIPGVGFLFAGLGAVTTGGLIVFGIIEPTTFISSSTYFFIFSILWAAILWIPLNRYLSSSKKNNYSSIIGQEVEVIEKAISAKANGKVKWSGTIMQAKLDPEYSREKIDIGETGEVVSVSGTILIIKPIGK